MGEVDSFPTTQDFLDALSVLEPRNTVTSESENKSAGDFSFWTQPDFTFAAQLKQVKSPDPQAKDMCGSQPACPSRPCGTHQTIAKGVEQECGFAATGGCHGGGMGNQKVMPVALDKAGRFGESASNLHSGPVVVPFDAAAPIVQQPRQQQHLDTRHADAPLAAPTAALAATSPSQPISEVQHCMQERQAKKMRTDNTVPQWALDAMSDFPRCHEHVLAILSPECQEQVHKAQVPESLRRLVLAAAMVSSEAWTNVDCWVLARLVNADMLKSLAPGVVPVQTLPQQVVEPPLVVNLCVISACSGSGIPCMAVQWALQTLRQKHPLTSLVITVVRAVAYEVDETARRIAYVVHQSLQFAVEQRASVESLEQDMEDLVRTSKASHYLFLCGTECTDTSCANQARVPQGKSPLHGPSSRVFFWVYSALKKLQELVGISFVAFVSELPKCKLACAEEELNSRLGEPVHSDASEWEGADRSRYWRTSPLLPGPERKRVYFPPMDRKAPCRDGSVWTPSHFAQKSSKHPPVLRAFWPILVHQVTSKRRCPTPWETFNLQSLLVTRDGQVRYAGVAFFEKFLGLQNTPIEQATKQYPCHQHCFLRDGSPAMVGSMDSAPCGKLRFCRNCEAMLRVLGKAWHLPQATEIVLATLEGALSVWQCLPGAPPTWACTMPGHICGPECPLAYGD